MKNSLVIFLIILLAGCSNYPDHIQFQGKTLNRYITVISTTSNSNTNRVSRDTVSYYADSTGMPYFITYTTGETNLFSRQNGDSLFYDRMFCPLEKDYMLIRNSLVRRLTDNTGGGWGGNCDLSYDNHKQLCRLQFEGQENDGIICGLIFKCTDYYRYVWKNGLLTEIYFNGKLRNRIFYDETKRGLNAGLPALYMADYEQISSCNDGLIYLLAGYLGRIPDAKVDSIETYDLESGKLKYSRKVESKFDFRGRLTEYTMQEYRKRLEIDTITSTLKLVY